MRDSKSNASNTDATTRGYTITPAVRASCMTITSNLRWLLSSFLLFDDDFVHRAPITLSIFFPSPFAAFTQKESGMQKVKCKSGKSDHGTIQDVYWASVRIHSAGEKEPRYSLKSTWVDMMWPFQPSDNSMVRYIDLFYRQNISLIVQS